MDGKLRDRGVFEFEPLVCYGDCDNSGTLAIDDFIRVQALFALSEPASDWNESSKLSVNDFICVQSLFANGR